MHLKVGRSYRVACTVWIRESIDESVQRSLDELHKRLLDGILLGSIKHRVF